MDVPSYPVGPPSDPGYSGLEIVHYAFLSPSQFVDHLDRLTEVSICLTGVPRGCWTSSQFRDQIWVGCWEAIDKQIHYCGARTNRQILLSGLDYRFLS